MKSDVTLNEKEKRISQDISFISEVTQNVSADSQTDDSAPLYADVSSCGFKLRFAPSRASPELVPII